jgi:ParB/RepB/Spo0J family partition protein
MKRTVTILEDKRRITLFRVPKGSPVRHQQLGDGLTVLGDGNILELPSRRGDTGTKRHFAEGRSPGEVDVAAAPKWLLDSAATDAQIGGAQVRAPRVVATRDIKIADILFRDRLRPVRAENVAKLAESLKQGQYRSITVRPHPKHDEKFEAIAGVTLIKAAESLGWTHIRADILECDDKEAELWEALENLYRSELTALEEAEHFAACIRLIADRESRQIAKLDKGKGGRPEGVITKTARDLPVPGKTQAGRKKAIERGLRIAAISPEVKKGIIKAGLDDKKSALNKIVGEGTPEAQLAKLKEITAGKSDGAARASARASKRHSETLSSPAYNPASALSDDERQELDKLMDLWNEADELKETFAETSPAVQIQFTEKIRAPDEPEENESEDGQTDSQANQEDDNDDWD